MNQQHQINSTRALFLHWGPGASSFAERQVLGTALEIDWWDQPRFSQDETQAFTRTVEAAQKRLEELFSLQQSPVSIYAHSFGGQLARVLARRRPKQIESITLLACNESPLRAFLNLAEHLQKSKPSPELERALQEARKSLKTESFWPLVQAILAREDFFIHYWGPSSQTAKEKFFAATANQELSDAATFTAVMNEYLQQGFSNEAKEPIPFEGKVKLVTGLHDPLIDPQQELQAWKNHFPQTELVTLDSGHFIQFERPNHEWRMPGR